MGKQVVALVCADIHLSLTAPVARSAEPDWLAAQGRVLNQVRRLADQHQCPVICAGDIFDRHNSPPELINWAIDNLPTMYAVPGQHDLPLHSYEDLHRSAYWTLERAKAIVDLGKAGSWALCPWGRVCMHSFPWGSAIRPLEDSGVGEVQVAVIHSYVWTSDSCYSNAPKKMHASLMLDKLKGYDVAVFGDNHIRFQKGRLYNCGCLIRRRIDEKSLRPAVGFLFEDGSIEPHELDCSEDKWIGVEEAIKLEGRTAELDAFLRELEGVEADYLDFAEEVKRYIADPVNKVSEATKSCVVEMLEES